MKKLTLIVALLLIGVFCLAQDTSLFEERARLQDELRGGGAGAQNSRQHAFLIDDDNVREGAGIKVRKIDMREIELTNMLATSGFEDWTNGTSVQPNNWTDEGSPTVAQDTAEQGHDDYNLKLTATGAANEGSTQTMANLKAETQYRLIVRAKVTAGDIARIITTGAVTNVDKETGSTAWMDMVGHFTTDSSGTDVVVKLVAKTAGDIVWFDDVQVTESHTKLGFLRDQAQKDRILGFLTGGTGVQGSVVFLNSSGWLAQDNPNFFWDDGNDRLGLGTQTPAQQLSMSGTLIVNAVNEYTPDAGVTIEGVQMLDNNIQLADTAYIGLAAGGKMYSDDTGNALAVTTRMIVSSAATAWPANFTTEDFIVGNGAGNAEVAIYCATNGNSKINFTDTDSTSPGHIDYDHTTNVMQFKADGTDSMSLDNFGNMGVGTAATQALAGSGTRSIVVATGTAPTGVASTNMFAMYSADFAAGNACPYFRTENGTVIGLNQSLLTTDDVVFNLVTSATNVYIADNGYIGSASDTDAIQIEADGDVALTQQLYAQNIYIADDGYIGSRTDNDAMRIRTAGDIYMTQDLSVAGIITDGTASLTGGSLTSVKLGTLTSNGFVKTSSGDGTLSVDTTAYVAAHAILDGSAHTDSVADGVDRGSLIYGNSTPKWDELVISTGFLGGDGTDASWRGYANTLADLSGNAAATFDFNSQIVTGVADAVDLTDAVNLDTLLEHIGISIHYWLGNQTLDLTLTDSESSLSETPNAEPDELTTITFKSSVADTPAPFLITAGEILDIHFAGDETSGAGRNIGVYFQLGYVDADGTTDFVQIGSNSDTSDAFTGTKTTYRTHVHVASDTTVPAGKRMWLKVFATTVSGAGGYPTIRIYYDHSEHHMNIPVGGSVLGSFVKVDGTSPLTANWDVGNFGLTSNNLTIDGTFTDGTMSIVGGALSSVGDVGCTTVTATGNITDGTYTSDGTGNFSGVGTFSCGVATLGDSSQMSTSAAPTADADLANKKYVDDNVGNTYTDAGDLAAWDLQHGAMTTDGGTYDWDVSGIVPVGTVAVTIYAQITDNLVGTRLEITEKGVSNFINEGVIRAQVANQTIDAHFIVAVDADRKLQYRATNTTFTSINLAVRGWFH